MPQLTRTRTVRLLLAAPAVIALVLCGAPSAAADPTNGDAVCHSSQESGVEVDTCTGNPNAPAAGPGVQVRIAPQFCIGLGFGGCDDD